MINSLHGIPFLILGIVIGILIQKIYYKKLYKKILNGNMKFTNEKEAMEYILEYYYHLLVSEAKTFKSRYMMSYSEEFDKEEFVLSLTSYLTNVIMSKIINNNHFSDKELNIITDEVLDKCINNIIEKSGVLDNIEVKREIIENNNELVSNTKSNSVDIASAMINFYD